MLEYYTPNCWRFQVKWYIFSIFVYYVYFYVNTIMLTFNEYAVYLYIIYFYRQYVVILNFNTHYILKMQEIFHFGVLHNIN